MSTVFGVLLTGAFHEDGLADTADGLGGGEELELGIKKIAEWYKAFPVADVTLGNHDIIISRKAQSGSIPKKWIKAYKAQKERERELSNLHNN